MVRNFSSSSRFLMNWLGSTEEGFAESDPDLRRAQIAPHITYAISTNVLATLAFRVDLFDFSRGSSVVGVLDATF